MSTAEHPDALARRIEQLAAASTDDPDGAALLALRALRTELGAVRAELGSMRAETGAVRSDLEGLGGRLAGAVAAGRSETSALARLVAELASRLDGLGSRVEDVRTGLTREVRDSSEHVPHRTGTRIDALGAELTDALGGRVDAVAAEVRRSLADGLERAARASAEQGTVLEDTRGTLEARLAVLEDVLDALSERIEALARDGAGTTTSLLQSLGERVRGLERHLAESGRQSAELLAARIAESADARAGRLEDDLLGRLSTTLAERDEALRAELRAALQGAEERATRDRAAAQDLATTVRDALHGFAAGLDRTLSGVERSLSALAARQERADERVSGVEDRLSAALAGLHREVLSRDEDAAVRLHDLRGAVEDRLEQVRAHLAGAVTALHSEVTAELGGLAPRLDELAVGGAAGRASLSELRADVLAAAEELRERLLSATGGSTDRLRGEVERLAAVVTGDVVVAGRELREDLAARTAEQLAALAELSGAARELEQTVGGLRDEWPTRTYEVVEGAKAVAQGVVLDVRDEVAARLAQVRDTLAQAVHGLDQARTGLDDGTDRLAHAGAVLVAYLEQRDRLLGAERDRMLHEALEAFASGLPAGERAALAGRVGDVLARRRDARAAESSGGAIDDPVPAAAALPDDVLDLVPPDAERARREATASGPAAPGDQGASPVPPASSPEVRTGTRTGAAVARPASARPAPGGTSVLPGPGKRGAGQPGAGAAPPRPAARPGDRRGRLDVMPEVPSVDVALEAAAPAQVAEPPAGDATEPRSR